MTFSNPCPRIGKGGDGTCEPATRYMKGGGTFASMACYYEDDRAATMMRMHCETPEHLAESITDTEGDMRLALQVGGVLVLVCLIFAFKLRKELCRSPVEVVDRRL